MRIIFSLLIACSLLTACSSSKPATASKTSSSYNSNLGGDGSSLEQAIVIQETSEGKGVNAEYAWLKVHYPGYKVKSQSLNYKGDKKYDVLDIVTAEGSVKKVYFDITNFFGKF